MGKLDGKVALVTGAGTGIGRGGAIALGRDGAAVVLCGPDLAPLAEAAAAVEAAGGRAAYTPCDVTDWAQAKAAVGFAATTFGRLDILYNNAGIAGTGTIDEIDEVFWDRVMAVNLKGGFLMAKAAVPEMRRAGGGVIVNTLSVLAFNTFRGQAAYAASKAGVVGLTRALAIDLADDHIRVLAVVPGSVDTPMMWGDATPEQRAAWEALIRREHVARRVAEPDEVGRVVAFLVSEDASFMTGSCVIVDGGTLQKWGGGI